MWKLNPPAGAGRGGNPPAGVRRGGNRFSSHTTLVLVGSCGMFHRLSTRLVLRDGGAWAVLVYLNGLLECVVEIDLLQSRCEKRSLGSMWQSSRIILNKIFKKIADVGIGCCIRLNARLK